MEHKLEVDVHAHWSDNPPIYRIYVDDEMLTERTFGWTSYQFYITEHLFCFLDTGVHTLRLESIDTDSRFELENLVVDQVAVTKNLYKTNGVKSEWRFVIDNLLKNTPKNQTNFAVNLEKISRPNPPMIPEERPRVQVQQKKYGTALPLVQRMRELNDRAAKK